MGWRDIIGNLLMKAGDAIPAPKERVIADPFNYVLNRLLQNGHRSPTELLADVQAVFPTVTPAEGNKIIHQIGLLQNMAFDFASEVNKQQISEDSARERIKQAYPQIDAANLSRLLMQGLIGTR